jgi:hypothetical protein
MTLRRSAKSILPCSRFHRFKESRMGIAISIFGSFATQLQLLARWLGASASEAAHPGTRLPRAPLNGSPRPLRVVRIMESGCTAHSAGRMRMSGRMADVCAELDRMAAQEAARR